MTGRRLAQVAITATAVVVLGLAARPLLPTGRHPLPVGLGPTSRGVPAAAGPAAARLARSALACRTGAGARACGALTVTRTATYRAPGGRVVVLLVGTLVPAVAGAATPVALRVTLARTVGGWHGRVGLP